MAGNGGPAPRARVALASRFGRGRKRECRYRTAEGECVGGFPYGPADLAELRTAAEIAHQKLIELYANSPS